MSKALCVRKAVAGSMVALIGLTCIPALGESPAAGTGYKYPGITTPSEQRGLNFNLPGVVSKVMVKEGDAVKKGDVLAQEDDSVDQAELVVKQAEVAAAKLQIDAAKADLASKKIERDRAEKMLTNKVTSQSEIEKARLDVTIGEIRVHLSEEETNGKELEVKAQEAKIAQKKLLSTIDGIVQKINVHEGELATNDPKTPCLQVVLNEPLYVEVDMPVGLAKSLALKQKLDVQYADETAWHPAEITYFNPVANAAAGTQRVRLTLDNEGHVRSGLQMQVKLPDKVAAVDPAR